MVVGVDAKHGCIGDELPWADAEHHSPASLVIELDDAIGEDERVVVGERIDTSSELDVFGALRRRSNKDLGTSDQVASAVMVHVDTCL